MSDREFVEFEDGTWDTWELKGIWDAWELWYALVDCIQQTRQQLWNAQRSPEIADRLATAIEATFVLFSDEPDKADRASRFLRNSLDVLPAPQEIVTRKDRLKDLGRQRMWALLNSLLFPETLVDRRVPLRRHARGSTTTLSSFGRRAAGQDVPIAAMFASARCATLGIGRDPSDQETGEYPQ